MYVVVLSLLLGAITDYLTTFKFEGTHFEGKVIGLLTVIAGLLVGIYFTLDKQTDLMAGDGEDE